MTPTPTSSPRPARRRWPVRRPRVPRPPSVPLRCRRHSAALRPNGHYAPSNAASCCLSPASSSFSQQLLGFFRAPSPRTRRLSCKQRSLSCSRYTSLWTAIQPPCHRVTRGLYRALSLTPTSVTPCAYAPCPLAPTDIDAAFAPAIHIRTDFVQSPRRRVPPNPPVPSSTAAADRISEGLCAPLAPTCLECAHRSPRSKAKMSFLEELGGLGTDGDAIHPRRARNLRLYSGRARLLGVAPTGPLRVRRQHHGTFPRGCPQGCRLRRQIGTWNSS
ncbi:hypothetical protein K438DRAFT_770418 [Mycena galopus ATCC 62051]|nr:hypothetical protein K438DRAFT_770418 [Mycena galopus ATCC 62051]